MVTRDIARHELIGLAAEITDCGSRCLVGQKGRIIDETKHTFTLLTGKKERKTVVKKGCTAIFTLRTGEKVRIDCSILDMKPEDRIKMRIK